MHSPIFDLTPERLSRETAFLQRIARELLVDEALVEDVVQETWLAALRRPPERSLRPWLTRVTRNFARRVLRKGKTRRSSEKGAARPEALPSAGEIVGKMTLHRELAAAVLGLDEPYRTTLVVRYWENLAPRQIAERMDLPVNTVRTRLRRAIASLREELDRKRGGRKEWLAMLPVAWRNGRAGASVDVAAGGLLMSTALKIAGVAAGVLAVLWVSSDLLMHVDSGSPPVSPVVTADTQGTASEGTGTTDGQNQGVSRSEIVLEVPAGPQPVVTGRVMGEDTGLPVAGASVRLGPRFMRDSTSVLEGNTDESGRFEIVAERFSGSNSDDFEVTAEGYARLRGDLRDSWQQMDPAHPDLGEILLLRGVAASGQVVRAEDRVPVSDARIYLIEEPDKQLWTGLSFDHAREQGVTGVDGSFQLPERLPPTVSDGHLLLAITADGFGATLVRAVRGRDRIDGIEIPVTTGANVSVTVQDEKGEPLPGAKARAVPLFTPLHPEFMRITVPVASLTGPAELVRRFSGTTDEDGVLQLSGLPVGTGESSPLYRSGWPYEVVGISDGYLLTHGSVRVQAGGSYASELKLEPEVASLVLTGSVTTYGGAALEGATVTVGYDSVKTDAEGRYRLETREPGEQLVYRVRADKYVDHDEWVPVAPTETGIQEQNFVLGKSMPIVGRVVDQHGLPVAGISVRATREGNATKMADEPETGPDGQFRISDTTPGSWLLVTLTDSATHGVAPFPGMTVEAGDWVEIPLYRLETGQTRLVAEIVELHTGEPMDPVLATLFEEGPWFSNHVRSVKTERRTGLVTAEGVPPGRWELTVETVAGTEIYRSFEVLPGESVKNLRIEAGPPGVITGRVIFDDIPVESRPERVSFVSPGMWVSEPGVQVPGVTDRYFYVTRDGDKTFRLEKVPVNNPALIWTFEGSQVSGLAEVTVPAEGEAHVEIRLGLDTAARIAFSMAGFVEGRLKLWTAHEDGPWIDRASVATVREADSDKSVRVLPGRNRWRMRFQPALGSGVPLELIEREGEVVVRPGETVEVSLGTRE